MKLSSFVAVGALVFASHAQAFTMPADFPAIFQGGGNWIASDATKGTWTETFEISKAEGGVAVREVINIEMAEGVSETMESKWNMVFKDKNFFDVVVADKVVGSGYCIENHCHYDMTIDGGKFDETLELHRRKTIVKTGSQKMEKEGKPFTVAWQGTLKQLD